MGAITAVILEELLAQQNYQTAKAHLREVIWEFRQYKKTGFPDFEPTTHYTFLNYEDLAAIYWQWAALFPELYSEDGSPLSQDTVLQNQDIQISIEIETVITE